MQPSFFMTTAGEFEPLAAPRACWENGRFRDRKRDDYMLIAIEPALDGQRFGLGAADIMQLIVSTRLPSQTLYPISKWPIEVYVSRIKDAAILKSAEFTPEQVELIAWGALFRTREAASIVAQRFQR